MKQKVWVTYLYMILISLGGMLAISGTIEVLDIIMGETGAAVITKISSVIIIGIVCVVFICILGNKITYKQIKEKSNNVKENYVACKDDFDINDLNEELIKKGYKKEDAHFLCDGKNVEAHIYSMVNAPEKNMHPVKCNYVLIENMAKEVKAAKLCNDIKEYIMNSSLKCVVNISICFFSKKAESEMIEYVMNSSKDTNIIYIPVLIDTEKHRAYYFCGDKTMSKDYRQMCADIKLFLHAE